jgi:hypothetical protein
MILQMCSDDSFSINDLAAKLTVANIDYKSRDSLYKQAELLVAAGLLEKFYDVNKKAITYKNPVIEVVIDIVQSTVEQKREEKLVRQ